MPTMMRVYVLYFAKALNKVCRDKMMHTRKTAGLDDLNIKCQIKLKLRKEFTRVVFYPP